MSDPVSDLKHELLAAAERQHGHAPVHAGRRWLGGHLGRNRLLLAAATLAIAAAVALLFTAPWDRSPGFLARAEAALTPPAGTILHVKWETTVTSTKPACTVTRGPSELWVDETRPHAFRIVEYPLLVDAPVTDWRQVVCSRGTASEYGGTKRSKQTLRFVPPNTLSVEQQRFRFSLDPAAGLREAISAGRAQDEGKTQLDGRTVERIRIDPSACRIPSCPAGERLDVYVDPETFYPVEQDGGAVIPFYPPLRVHHVTRYLAFEYLPRTAANLALTDIQAQHPNATGP
jgi:hypothetical protein